MSWRNVFIRPVKRLSREQSGATAVEFAMVGPLFFALIFSMLETGIMISRVSLLDNAMANAAKLVYTGQAPEQEDIQEEICGKAFMFNNCEENVHVELTVIDDDWNAPDTDAECRDSEVEDEELQPATRYSTGNTSEIIFMRVCVTTDIVTPGIGVGLSLPKTDTGRFQIVSSMTFMNEPF